MRALQHPSGGSGTLIGKTEWGAGTARCQLLPRLARDFTPGKCPNFNRGTMSRAKLSLWSPRQCVSPWVFLL